MTFPCTYSDRVSSEDHQTVDFPLHMLPPDAYIGCVVEINIELKPQYQRERLALLHQVCGMLYRRIAIALHSLCLPACLTGVRSDRDGGAG